MFRTKLAHRAVAAAASVVALTATTLVAVTTGGVAHAEAPYTNWRPTTSDWKDGYFASLYPSPDGTSTARWTSEQLETEMDNSVKVEGTGEDARGVTTWTLTYNQAYTTGKYQTNVGNNDATREKWLSYTVSPDLKIEGDVTYEILTRTRQSIAKVTKPAWINNRDKIAEGTAANQSGIVKDGQPEEWKYSIDNLWTGNGTDCLSNSWNPCGNYFGYNDSDEFYTYQKGFDDPKSSELFGTQQAIQDKNLRRDELQKAQVFILHSPEYRPVDVVAKVTFKTRRTPHFPLTFAYGPHRSFVMGGWRADDEGRKVLRAAYKWLNNPQKQQKNVDTDGDGLNDAAEFALGSDPNKTDTDHDGISDGAEMKYQGAADMIEAKIGGEAKVMKLHGSDPTYGRAARPQVSTSKLQQGTVITGKSRPLTTVGISVPYTGKGSYNGRIYIASTVTDDQGNYKLTLGKRLKRNSWDALNEYWNSYALDSDTSKPVWQRVQYDDVSTAGVENFDREKVELTVWSDGWDETPMYAGSSLVSWDSHLRPTDTRDTAEDPYWTRIEPQTKTVPALGDATTVPADSVIPVVVNLRDTNGHPVSNAAQGMTIHQVNMDDTDAELQLVTKNMDGSYSLANAGIPAFTEGSAGVYTAYVTSKTQGDLKLDIKATDYLNGQETATELWLNGENAPTANGNTPQESLTYTFGPARTVAKKVVDWADFLDNPQNRGTSITPTATIYNTYGELVSTPSTVWVTYPGQDTPKSASIGQGGLLQFPGFTVPNTAFELNVYGDEKGEQLLDGGTKTVNIEPIIAKATVNTDAKVLDGKVRDNIDTITVFLDNEKVANGGTVWAALPGVPGLREITLNGSGVGRLGTFTPTTSENKIVIYKAKSATTDNKIGEFTYEITNQVPSADYSSVTVIDGEAVADGEDQVTFEIIANNQEGNGYVSVNDNPFEVVVVSGPQDYGTRLTTKLRNYEKPTNTSTVGAATTIAGDYTVHILMDGVAISKEPLEVKFLPGPIAEAPKHSTVSIDAGPKEANGDDFYTVTVVAKDVNDNLIDELAGELSLVDVAEDNYTFDPALSSVTFSPKKDANGQLVMGTYVAKVASKNVGTGKIQVQSNGTKLGDPLTAEFVTGAIKSPELTAVPVGGNSFPVTAGDQVTLTYTLKDSSDHIITDAQGGVIANVAGVVYPLDHQSDGTYSAKVKLTKAGEYKVSASLEGQYQAEAKVSVVPGPLTAENNHSTLKWYQNDAEVSSIEAGTTAAIVMTPHDSYDNIIDLGKAIDVTLEVAKAEGALGTVQESSLHLTQQPNGTYTAVYTPTVAGTYTASYTKEKQTVKASLAVTASGVYTGGTGTGDGGSGGGTGTGGGSGTGGEGSGSNTYTSTSSIDPSGYLNADGQAAYTVTAKLYDRYGNPVDVPTTELALIAGTPAPQTSPAIDTLTFTKTAAGTYTATISSSYPTKGNVQVQYTKQGADPRAIGGALPVDFRPVGANFNPDYGKVSWVEITDGVKLANGTDAHTLTFHFVDSQGDPVDMEGDDLAKNLTVDVVPAAPAPGTHAAAAPVGVTVGTPTKTANGVYTVDITSTVVGTFTLNATYKGNAFRTQAGNVANLSVTFGPGVPYTADFGTIEPVEPGDTVSPVAAVQDQWGHAVPGATVTVTITPTGAGESKEVTLSDNSQLTLDPITVTEPVTITVTNAEGRVIGKANIELAAAEEPVTPPTTTPAPTTTSGHSGGIHLLPRPGNNSGGQAQASAAATTTPAAAAGDGTGGQLALTGSAGTLILLAGAGLALVGGLILALRRRRS